MTDTNLPELPEGKRWNVVKVVDEDYIPAQTFYDVRLESKRWWGWSWVDRLRISVLSKEMIQTAAQQIIERQEAWRQAYHQEEKYLGTYPPKTLG